ncbi:chorismate-binding protein [Flagellimonas iocasae]|uniref:isochorismate synthase n=1 Tax=Flagellimonas iocasae TaxID=2055905 RepID=A0ABW4XXY2_9FLAO
MPYQENKEFQNIFRKIEASLENDLPFAVYRKPKQKQVTAVFQGNDVLHKTMDFEGKGFVFAPFDLKENAILIQPDEVLSATFQIGVKTESTTVEFSASGKEAHINLVKKGISEIEKGHLKKVVLSRKLEVDASSSPVEIFQNLLNNYPNAFCYIFHHPKIGTWCGATPETLVEIKDRQLKTMSLAATLPFNGDEKPQWGTKEIEEQRMVSDYIQERLGPAMEELHIGEAESIRAGNLWHLRSEVTGTLSSGNGIKKVITALHPTPAVCGIPTQAAKSFILENENYQRRFYTGFLGELNLNEVGEASLFVNLRCMELQHSKATLFVGGGITSASQPESEWVETQNKSKTMLNIL